MAGTPENYKVAVYMESADEEGRAFHTTEGAFISAVADNEIAKFDEFFQRELGNDPLTRGEKATIKTYLHFHLGPKRKVEGAEG